MRVVFTGGEHVGGLAAARGLRRAGHEAHAVTSTAESYVGRSRAVESVTLVPSPLVDPAGFAAAVAETARRLRADVVLPGVEAALLALAASRGLFTGTAVGVPAPEVVERATDKSLLDEVAPRSGLAAPPTTTISRENAAASAATVGYPVVLKPLRSDVQTSGGRRVHASPTVARTPEELASALAATAGDRWLLQPFLASGLEAVCGVAWEGSVVSAMHQRALRIWPPDCGISSYAETVPPNPKLEGGVRRLVEAIGWSGVFQAQFLHDGNESFLIDFNPRFYGSMALAIAAGHNLPAIWVDLLTGGAPRVPAYRVGVRYRTEEGDPRALLRALRRGDRRAALRGLVPRPNTVHPILDLRDPGPFAISAKKLLRL